MAYGLPSVLWFRGSVHVLLLKLSLMFLLDKGLNCTHEDHIMSHPALHDALNDPRNGDCAVKHLKQQVCLDTITKRFFICVVLTFQADEMAHQIKALAAKPEDPNSVI